MGRSKDQYSVSECRTYFLQVVETPEPPGLQVRTDVVCASLKYLIFLYVIPLPVPATRSTNLCTIRELF